MNAPEKHLDLVPPAFLERRQPAKFGWWSDRTLMIVKGDQEMTLDADDLRGLARFIQDCNAEERP